MRRGPAQRGRRWARACVLVDAGRGVAESLRAARIPVPQPDTLLLTSLLPENTVGLDDLLLTGWLEGRARAPARDRPARNRARWSRAWRRRRPARSRRSAPRWACRPRAPRASALEIAGRLSETLDGLLVRAAALARRPAARAAYRFEAGGRSIVVSGTRLGRRRAGRARARRAPAGARGAPSCPRPRWRASWGSRRRPTGCSARPRCTPRWRDVGALARAGGGRRAGAGAPAPAAGLRPSRSPALVDDSFGGRILVPERRRRDHTLMPGSPVLGRRPPARAATTATGMESGIGGLGPVVAGRARRGSGAAARGSRRSCGVALDRLVDGARARSRDRPSWNCTSARVSRMVASRRFVSSTARCARIRATASSSGFALRMVASCQARLLSSSGETPGSCATRSACRTRNSPGAASVAAAASTAMPVIASTARAARSSGRRGWHQRARRDPGGREQPGGEAAQVGLASDQRDHEAERRIEQQRAADPDQRAPRKAPPGRQRLRTAQLDPEQPPGQPEYDARDPHHRGVAQPPGRRHRPDRGGAHHAHHALAPDRALEHASHRQQTDQVEGEVEREGVDQVGGDRSGARSPSFTSGRLM